MIRYTVGKITPIQRREVRTTDFGPRASFWMNFPKEGSQLTPSHQSEDFKWKDYCPMVFRFVPRHPFIRGNELRTILSAIVLPTFLLQVLVKQ